MLSRGIVALGEKLEAEQMLLRWASGCSYGTPYSLPDALDSVTQWWCHAAYVRATLHQIVPRISQVQILRGDLQRTSAQLQEVRQGTRPRSQRHGDQFRDFNLLPKCSHNNNNHTCNDDISW